MRNHGRHGIVDGTPILPPASILQVIEQFYDYMLILVFIGFINIVEFAKTVESSDAHKQAAPTIVRAARQKNQSA